MCEEPKPRRVLRAIAAFLSAKHRALRQSWPSKFWYCGKPAVRSSPNRHLLLIIDRPSPFKVHLLTQRRWKRFEIGIYNSGPCFKFLLLIRGYLKSKSKFFLVLTYLKIWDTQIQELFTEFKKLLVVEFCAVANLARFAKCIGFSIFRKNRVKKRSKI